MGHIKSIAPAVDAIRLSLLEARPVPTPVEAVGPPQDLTGSRAALVRWWRWRYSTLKAENARLAAQRDQVLNEAQGYRALLQASLDTQHEEGRRLVRLREQHHRVRDEYRDHRVRVLRDEQRHGQEVTV